MSLSKLVIKSQDTERKSRIGLEIMKPNNKMRKIMRGMMKVIIFEYENNSILSLLKYSIFVF